MTTSTEIEELRNLLDVAERERIDVLELRVLELERELNQLMQDKTFRTGFVSDVLPLAVTQRGAADGGLTRSVQPHVVEAINLSSRHEPDDMAAALYPVLGPAIRKMVASYFTLERSSKNKFTPEQVFLIEPDSGLIVRHLTAESMEESSDDASGEADVISGMLEAIRSFVQDSFDVDNHDGMRELTVGDITVIVEWGPAAILACVVRGIGTDEYRTAIQQTLEEIHTNFTDELASYEGDPDTMTILQPTLDSLLEYQPKQSSSRSSKLSGPNIAWAAIVLVATVCFVLFLIGL